MSRFTNWWRIVGILVGLELRQRTRATRWRIMLGAFFLAVSAAVFGLLWFITTTSPISGRQTFDENLYFIVLGFVGFLGVVIAPTMTATSINGDRKDATLAVVQATPAGGLQLATGKLLGAWIASCGLLGCRPRTSSGRSSWSSTPLLFALLGIGVTALIFLCYCGIGLGFSALLARPIGSAAVTQLAVLSLLIGLPVLTMLLVPATEARVPADRPQWTYSESGTRGTCEIERTAVTVEHTERIWWILSPNPAVVLADAAAQRDPPAAMRIATAGPGRGTPRTTAAHRRNPVWGARDGVAELRTGPAANQDRTCAQAGYSSDDNTSLPEYADPRRSDGYLGHTWYWGLLANLALGGVGLAFAARRLRVPAGRLPRGVRDRRELLAWCALPSKTHTIGSSSQRAERTSNADVDRTNLSG